MTWRRVAIGAGVLAAAALAWWWGVPAAIDLVGRGRQLTETELDDNLSIAESPEELARAAGEVLGRDVDPTALGVARMLRSEEPNANHETKTYLVHVLRNDASKLGWSILRTLTYSTVASRNGKFGKQTSRRYSTRSDPYERDLVIAELALTQDDTTNGARKFYHKQGGPIAGIVGYDDVVERWGSEGLRPFNLPGAPSALVFFGEEVPT